MNNFNFLNLALIKIHRSSDIYNMPAGLYFVLKYSFFTFTIHLA